MSQWGAHGMVEQERISARSSAGHRGADVVPFRAVHDPALAMRLSGATVERMNPPRTCRVFLTGSSRPTQTALIEAS